LIWPYLACLWTALVLGVFAYAVLASGPAILRNVDVVGGNAKVPTMVGAGGNVRGLVGVDDLLDRTKKGSGLAA